LKLPDIKA